MPTRGSTKVRRRALSRPCSPPQTAATAAAAPALCFVHDTGRLEALLLALVLLVPAAILAEGALGAALGAPPGVAGGCCAGSLSALQPHLLACQAHHLPSLPHSRCPAGGLYRQRQAGSCGLALGALALPCTLAGLAAKQHQQYASSSAAALAPAAHQLLASVAASSAALVLLLWRLRPAAAYPLPSYGTPRAAKQRRSSSGTNAQHVPLRLWLPALMLACGALLAASAAAAALAQRSDKLHAVAALLLVAGTAGACTHALLALLPRAFTAGEALVAAQAAVLLGASALQQLPGAASLGVAADAACRRFVVLLSAGSLLAAATLFPLLLWLQQRARQRQTRRHSRSAPITTVAGAAALAVASLCLAALVPAALWALRLAASTRRRRLLMAWWAADLVAALPIMRWLSGSGRLRSILGMCSMNTASGISTAVLLACSHCSVLPHPTPLPCTPRTRVLACLPQCARATTCWRSLFSCPPCCWSRRCWGWRWPAPGRHCWRWKRCACRACRASVRTGDYDCCLQRSRDQLCELAESVPAL